MGSRNEDIRIEFHHRNSKVKNQFFQQWGTDSIPAPGAKIPHASGSKSQNIKQKEYCNKLNKDFKNGPH